MNAFVFGLSSIKNFGDGISETIINERKERGPFKTLSDFLARVGSKNLNRKSLESPIKCGALDSLCASGRTSMIENIETMLAFHKSDRHRAAGYAFGTLMAPPPLVLPGRKTDYPARQAYVGKEIAWYLREWSSA